MDYFSAYEKYQAWSQKVWKFCLNFMLVLAAVVLGLFMILLITGGTEQYTQQSRQQRYINQNEQMDIAPAALHQTLKSNQENHSKLDIGLVSEKPYLIMFAGRHCLDMCMQQTTIIQQVYNKNPTFTPVLFIIDPDSKIPSQHPGFPELQILKYDLSQIRKTMRSVELTLRNNPQYTNNPLDEKYLIPPYYLLYNNNGELLYRFQNILTPRGILNIYNQINNYINPEK